MKDYKVVLLDESSRLEKNIAETDEASCELKRGEAEVIDQGDMAEWWTFNELLSRPRLEDPERPRNRVLFRMNSL